MPEYLSPDIFVEEGQSNQQTIERVRLDRWPRSWASPSEGPWVFPFS